MRKLGISTDSTDTKKKIKEYYELYANKLDKFLKRPLYQSLCNKKQVT